jgi:hypothetical protein
MPSHEHEKDEMYRHKIIPNVLSLSQKLKPKTITLFTNPLLLLLGLCIIFIDVGEDFLRLITHYIL